MKRDRIMVLVDCRANMFEGDEPYFSTVMGVLVKVLKDKIISNDTDELGILLYGTRETHNPWNFKNMYLLQDLEPTTAGRIKEIEVGCRRASSAAHSESRPVRVAPTDYDRPQLRFRNQVRFGKGGRPVSSRRGDMAVQHGIFPGGRQVCLVSLFVKAKQ